MSLIGRPRAYHTDRLATSAERQRAFQRQRAVVLAAACQQRTLKAYHQHQRDTWEIPPEIFATYDAEFHFTLDVCATAATAKCARFFSPAEDGLAQDWGTDVCWMNPPYGRKISAWLEKAYRSSLAGATVVCLI